MIDKARLAAIQAMIFDCDGVLTDGGIFYDEHGDRTLRFDSQDGARIAWLCKRTDIKVAVLSGRPTIVAEARHRELGVHRFVGECRDKERGMIDLADEFAVPLKNTLYMGDDLADLPAFRVAGVRVAVQNAAPELKECADLVTHAAGGHGAVREVAEMVLKARGEWDEWVRALKEHVPPPVTVAIS